MFAEPTRMVLTRYGSRNDFQGASTNSWTSWGQGFSIEKGKITDTNYSLIAEQQAFSLNKMVETGYLTPDRARMLMSLEKKLEPGQVDMFEIVKGEWYDAGKTAALWSIAGQVWDRTTGLRNVPVAWELQKTRDGRVIDRSKYKYLWEWGRAAQAEPGAIAPLYAANATLNYLQLRAMGGKLEEAYVLAHSVGKVNSRLYSKMHPDTMFPEGWKNMDDALFMIPLKSALEKHPPRQASADVAKLIELSGGKLTDIQALDLIFDFRELRWSEMDYVTAEGRQSTPVIFSDVSYALEVLISQKIREHGLPQRAAQEIYYYLGTLLPKWLLHSGNTDGKYRNAADSLLAGHAYQERNAIEISSLDPELAKRDPKYVATVLLGAVAEYQFRFAESFRRVNGFDSRTAWQAAGREMQRAKFQFGVTTSFPEIQKQLALLKPNETIDLPATFVDPSIREFGVMAQATPYLFRDAKMHFFRFEDIIRLVSENPGLFQEGAERIRPGLWRAHYFMSQIDLF